MALTFKNVTKRTGADTHIYDTSVEFVENEFNILLGTTLAGKTTLLQLMAGLEVPTSGEIWFDGKNVTGVATQRRNVSMVHQQFINYPHFSVFDNIASPLRVAGVSKSDIESRVGRVAELLKLTPMLKRRPNELSGGQQQRTALARALVKEAELVLLDEPLANLDYKLREELRDELPKLLSDRKCTVVYATTEPTEALLLGGYTATIHEGRITQYGKTSDVYRRPTDLLTSQVFSDPPINTTKVIRQNGRMILNDHVSWEATGPAKDLPDGTYMMGIRPHFVTVDAGAADAVAIEGQVIVSELSGSESVIHFNLDDQAWVSLSHGIHAIDIGARATFYLNTSHCIYFGENQQLMAA